MPDLPAGAVRCVGVLRDGRQCHRHIWPTAAVPITQCGACDPDRGGSVFPTEEAL